MQGPFKKAKQIDEPLDRVTFIPEAEAAGLECIGILYFKAMTKKDACTTLGTVGAFLGDPLRGFPTVVLSVSISEVKRPVKYFWGVHDFVRGLRGAVLGMILYRAVWFQHEYLTQIGILHRDISENNIVLASRPGEERGYLIDFDTAILQEPEELIKATAPAKRKRGSLICIEDLSRSPSPIPPDESKPLKGLRTGHSLRRNYALLIIEGSSNSLGLGSSLT
ncbi:hypothetical protein BU15DRAFT_61007 [Melanogaster broomeanus]|nr:hypothetical protein BU15DRAFT_61007 [Melanogaster broomeanus]